MYFLVPSDDRVEEREKQDKYLDFAKKMKKLWNIKMIIGITPIIVGALETISRTVKKKTEWTRDQRKNWNFQITEQLKFVVILRRVLESWRYFMWKQLLTD